MLEKDLSKVQHILKIMRPYGVQQRLGYEYKNLPDLYSQIWSESIQIIEDLRPPGYESVVSQLREELLIFNSKL